MRKLLDATGQRMVDVGTADGHTALHVAAVNGLRQIAQLLVEMVSPGSVFMFVYVFFFFSGMPH